MNEIVQFPGWVHWLDADPARYWIPAWGMLLATALTALRAPAETCITNRASTWWLHSWLFAGLVLLTLVVCRWPTWVVPNEFNPDESQVISGAITLRHFPVYWKYVDGTTHGPICEYLLVTASWLGAPLNYFTARVVAVLLQAGALLGIWGTLRSFTSERVARLAVLPGLAFWSLGSWGDFVHYSTELPGIMLLSLACWALAPALSASKQNRRDSLRLYLAGLCLGAVPLAKLQSAPQAAFLAVVALLLFWFARREERPLFGRRMLWFTLGGLSLPAFALGFVLIYGLRNQVWTSVILSNLGYSTQGQHPFAVMPGKFFGFAATSPAFAMFFTGCVGFALLYSRSAIGRPNALRLGVGIAWALLGVTYFCVLRPCREAAHYLHLLVIPGTLLSGFVLASAVAEPTPDGSKRNFHWTPVFWFGLLALAPQIFDRVNTWQPFLGHLPEYEARRHSDTVRFLRSHARPGDTLAMWGWEPSLYVETGLPQGTRDPHTAFQLTEWPLQSFYVIRYVADLTRRSPAWFVDAVGQGGFIYEDRGAFAHERTPSLRAIIATRYELAAEFGNKRIYRLKPDAQK